MRIGVDYGHKNHLGWFERVEVGIYGLSDAGRQQMNEDG